MGCQKRLILINLFVLLNIINDELLILYVIRLVNSHFCYKLLVS